MPPNAVMRYVRIDFMNCRGRLDLAVLPAAIRSDAPSWFYLWLIVLFLWPEGPGGPSGCQSQ